MNIQLNFSLKSYLQPPNDILPIEIIKLVFTVTTSSLKKNIEIITKLDLEREEIFRVSKCGKDLGDETKKKYEALKSKKDTIVERDRRLAKQHKECLDVYNSIIDEKKSLKKDLDTINLKCKSLYNPA